MKTEKIIPNNEELQNINKNITELTTAICDKLENSGVTWLPIMVYSTLNIMAVAVEMNKKGGVKTNLVDMTQTFCDELMKAAEFREDFKKKNFN